MKGAIMHAVLNWKEGMAFEAHTGTQQLLLDAKSPLGKDGGPTPKELVVMGLAGCTDMDVIALLKKYKMLPKSFSVEAEATPSGGGVHPVVFTHNVIKFVVEGEVAADKLLEAVQLSQTKYCGVTAMLVKAFPIEYCVILNGTEVGRGEAKFN